MLSMDIRESSVAQQKTAAYRDLLDHLVEAGYDDLNLRPLAPAELKTAYHPHALDDAMGGVVIDHARLRELIGSPHDAAAYIGVAVYQQLVEELKNKVALDLLEHELTPELEGTAEAESRLAAEA